MIRPGKIPGDDHVQRGARSEKYSEKISARGVDWRTDRDARDGHVLKLKEAPGT